MWEGVHFNMFGIMWHNPLKERVSGFDKGLKIALLKSGSTQSIVSALVHGERLWDMKDISI